ncbi:MAG: c-type cytochrome [Gammaproteobacteria bacterium]|nr:c-type cytochrome [Gammaproteobacteria bacterium]
MDILRVVRYLALVFWGLPWTLLASELIDIKRDVELAISLKPNLDNGRILYSLCIVCHSPEGWGSHNGYYPQIAGQLPGVLIKQLADIRARNRDNPTMLPFSLLQALGGVQGMADVSAYISALPMSRDSDVGPGFDLALGEELYRKECAECHGDRGEGDDKEHIPMLQGQHYSYLKRQFNWIRIGKRRNADEKMVKQIQRFSQREISAMMDYVSRLKPPQEKLAPPGWQNPDFPGFSRTNLPPEMHRRDWRELPLPPTRPTMPQ